MSKRLFALFLAANMAAACAGDSSDRGLADSALALEDAQYIQPPEPIPHDLQRSYDAPLGQVMERAANALRKRGLTILAQSPERGTILAYYSGDPQPFVDCGHIRAPGREAIPMSAAETTLLLPSEDGAVQVHHSMRLDALVAVRFDNDGETVTLWPDVYYVLNRYTEEQVAGAGDDRFTQTVEFGDTARAMIDDPIGRIVCQSNGLLENSASLL